jgi:hypothetical protein
VFHVEQPGAPRQALDVRPERGHPKLSGHSLHDGHQSRQIVPVQFRRGIIEQQGGPARSFLFLDLELSQHEPSRNELLLPAGNMVFGWAAVDLYYDVATVRAGLGCAVTPIAPAIGPQHLEQAAFRIPAWLVSKGDRTIEERSANFGEGWGKPGEVKLTLLSQRLTVAGECS